MSTVKNMEEVNEVEDVKKVKGGIFPAHSHPVASSASSTSPTSSTLSHSVFDAVLLISFGGPEKSEDIRPFLANVLKGIPVPPARVEEVVKHYEHFGGASPLNDITKAQAAGLERLLREVGPPLPVFVGMRNWHPTLTETFETMVVRGVRRVAACILSAPRSEASIGKYVTSVSEVLAQLGPRAPAVEYLGYWGDRPLFVEAIGDRVEEAVRGWSAERRERATWIYTAHSIPEAMARASTYVQDLEATVKGVVKLTDGRRTRLAYQSRSGNPSEPWLGPDVIHVLKEEAEAGVKEVVVIPVGFVADHVEVLYDLDVEARETAIRLGIGWQRAGTVGAHPKFLALLASMVREKTGIPKPA